MAEQTQQGEPGGWRNFFIGAIRASVTTGTERDSIWSVPRPLIRLYLLLFTIQSGWLFWRIFRDTLAQHPGSRLESIVFETLGGVSSHGLGAAMLSLVVVEGVSTLMVMYSLGMNLIVRPIIRWHERRGEERGEKRGEERGEKRGEERGERRGEERGEKRGEERGEMRNHQRWQAWHQRSLDAAARGEPFDEPPPPPPHQRED